LTEDDLLDNARGWIEACTTAYFLNGENTKFNR
jgi:predicted RNase H-like HicB family nuclease